MAQLKLIPLNKNNITMIYGNMQFKHGYHKITFVNIRVPWCYHVMPSLFHGNGRVLFFCQSLFESDSAEILFS